MNRTKVNYIVDIIALVSFLVTAITGVVIFLFLPPGEGQRGMHSALFGYGRHDWGAVHDWAGIILLITVVIHLVLHFNWIVCTTKNMFKSDNCEIDKTQ